MKLMTYCYKKNKKLSVRSDHNNQYVNANIKMNKKGIGEFNIQQLE